MNLFLTMLPVLLLGMLLLLVVILLLKVPEKSFAETFDEGMYWVAGFFVAFSTEIWVIGSL